MANVIIAGGTGLIGRMLTKMLLDRHDEVIIFTTQKAVKNKIPQVRYVLWNPAEQVIDLAFQCDECTIINLAGAGVAEKRWSAERKKEITDSRTASLRTIYRSVESKQIICRRLISASAIGYYGSSEELIDENALPDSTFLSATCQQWEAEALKFRNLQVAVAIVRIGIVLSRDGGALKEFLKPLRFGIAGIPGTGEQVMSWVHIEDVCRAFLFLSLRCSDDIYNAVSDHPVTANQLFAAILKIIKGIKIHVPAFVLRLVTGEMGSEIMKSARISNVKLREAGFEFKYKEIGPAIENLCREVTGGRD